jgi:hypothetical protein
MPVQRITTSIRYSRSALCVIISRTAAPATLTECAKLARRISITSLLGNAVLAGLIRTIAIPASQIPLTAQSVMSNTTPKKEPALPARNSYLDVPSVRARIPVQSASNRHTYSTINPKNASFANTTLITAKHVHQPNARNA